MKLSPLASLRVLVAYLGESDLPAWWVSQFLSESGIEFSRFSFSSTPVSAAISGATLAARTVHDERIGKRGTRHLFRFDAGLERAVHREILEADQAELAALINSKESALEGLRALAVQTVEAPEGPVQVGWLGEEEKEAAVHDLAAHYLCGFQKRRVILPYFAQKK